jgi:hypothetical protein
MNNYIKYILLHIILLTIILFNINMLNDEYNNKYNKKMLIIKNNCYSYIMNDNIYENNCINYIFDIIKEQYNNKDLILINKYKIYIYYIIYVLYIYVIIISR